MGICYAEGKESGKEEVRGTEVHVLCAKASGEDGMWLLSAELPHSFTHQTEAKCLTIFKTISFLNKRDGLMVVMTIINT